MPLWSLVPPCHCHGEFVCCPPPAGRYVRRIRKYLGAYLVHLGGRVDAIVFSAGGQAGREEALACVSPRHRTVALVGAQTVCVLRCACAGGMLARSMQGAAVDGAPAQQLARAHTTGVGAAAACSAPATREGAAHPPVLPLRRAGIGENGDLIRRLACRDLEWAGVALDEERNRATVREKCGEIQASDSKLKVSCSGNCKLWTRI